MPGNGRSGGQQQQQQQSGVGVGVERHMEQYTNPSYEQDCNPATTVTGKKGSVTEAQGSAADSVAIGTPCTAALGSTAGDVEATSAGGTAHRKGHR